MNENILAATVTQVKIGLIEIEGLMLEDGRFAVAVPQMADIFPYFKSDRNNASTMLKRLMGKDFKTYKIKTQFNRNATLAVLLLDFERVVRRLDKAGDTVAEVMMDASLGLTFKQLFCDAFKIKFDEDDRQEYLIERMKHYKQFHPKLTRWLKEDAGGDSSKVNWGKEVNLFKNAAAVPLKPVDLYSKEELSKLNEAEAVYNALRGVGINHHDALRRL